jgi:hypothetical protein
LLALPYVVYEFTQCVISFGSQFEAAKLAFTLFTHGGERERSLPCQLTVFGEAACAIIELGTHHHKAQQKATGGITDPRQKIQGKSLLQKKGVEGRRTR